MTTEKKAFLYVDDDHRTVEAFTDNVRKEWNMNYDVLSNSTRGSICPAQYDAFEDEILNIAKKNIERIECIFMDIDFGASETAPDNTGLLLGRAIRRQWPRVPIIIATRFAETEIYKKGMIFDFDNICDPMELLHMDVNKFTGMLGLTRDKRNNFLASIGDTPISFRLGKHRYFKDLQIKHDIQEYAFVAMPFGEEIVKPDVWTIAIQEGCLNGGVPAVRVDEDLCSLAVMDKVAKLIFGSTIVVADLTGWNANVLYELGIAHTCNKPAIIISQRKSDMLVPFDVRHIKYIEYSEHNLSKLRSEICSAMVQWMKALQNIR